MATAICKIKNILKIKLYLQFYNIKYLLLIVFVTQIVVKQNLKKVLWKITNIILTNTPAASVSRHTFALRRLTWL